MTTYNPYRSAERHRRARVRKGMTAADGAKCAAMTLMTVLAFWAAAIIGG